MFKSRNRFQYLISIEFSKEEILALIHIWREKGFNDIAFLLLLVSQYWEWNLEPAKSPVNATLW